MPPVPGVLRATSITPYVWTSPLGRQLKKIGRRTVYSLQTSYVNTGQLPGGGDWTRFFAGTVSQHLVGVDPFYVQGKVDEMAALGELIEYYPHLAVRYAQGCWFVSPVVR